jgi:hypothetical protein
MCESESVGMCVERWLKELVSRRCTGNRSEWIHATGEERLL